MSKHKDKKRWLKYPLSVYKHWGLNQWNYFQKPKLIRRLKEVKQWLADKTHSVNH